MSARILVVDDEPDIRDMLSRHFKASGFEVDTAASGEAALAMMENKRYEIVISDIMMSGMTGIELLKAIRNEYPMTRVIMVTGHVTLENALACMRRGAETCVFKPFTSFAELDAAVERGINYLKDWQRKLLGLHNMRDGAPPREGPWTK